MKTICKIGYSNREKELTYEQKKKITELILIKRPNLILIKTSKNSDNVQITSYKSVTQDKETNTNKMIYLVNSDGKISLINEKKIMGNFIEDTTNNNYNNPFNNFQIEVLLGLLDKKIETIIIEDSVIKIIKTDLENNYIKYTIDKKGISQGVKSLDNEIAELY